MPGRMQDLTDAAMLAGPFRQMIVEQEGHTNRRVKDQKKSGDPSDFHAAAHTLTGQGCQASLKLICGRIGEWQEDGYERRKTALKRSSIPGLSWIRAHKTRTKMICLLRVW